MNDVGGETKDSEGNQREGGKVRARGGAKFEADKAERRKNSVHLTDGENARITQESLASAKDSRMRLRILMKSSVVKM